MSATRRRLLKRLLEPTDRSGVDVAPHLVDSEQTVDVLFAATSDAVFSVELASGRVVQGNEHLEILTGFSLQDLLGEPVGLLTPEDVPDREAPLRLALLQQPGLHEEVAMARADGFTAITTVRVTHVETETGPVAVCTARDETERRMLKRELITKHVALLSAHQDLAARQREIGELSQRLAAASKQAMLAEIAAEVAHAMNNPLGALLSSLRMLKRMNDAVPEDQQKRHARLVERCEGLGNRMAKVVEDLRVTCRRGTSARDDKGCDLAAETRSALAILAHRIPDNVTVNHRVEEARARVPAHEINHAIVNLIGNALEAIGDEGEIHVACGGTAERAFVVVSDSGPGIEDELAERIFEPFFSTKSERRGTGVGLSMVRRMAMLHGGTVTVEPRGELGGATFRIEVPGDDRCTE
ncbi:MAG: PAS domain-containing sensor histidine kinase [Myxococcota bacterium]